MGESDEGDMEKCGSAILNIFDIHMTDYKYIVR